MIHDLTYILFVISIIHSAKKLIIKGSFRLQSVSILQVPIDLSRLDSNCS